MRLETHGRWPLVAAAAVAPVGAAAVRRPELRPLAALLLHQTEEWVWPGGFLPWMNREVLGSGEDEFPLDPRMGLVINVGLGWGTSLATMAGHRAAAPSAFLYVSHLGNVVLHLRWAVRHRRYDPGLLTALLTLAPAAVIGLRALHADPEVSRVALAAAPSPGRQAPSRCRRCSGAGRGGLARRDNTGGSAARPAGAARPPRAW